MIRRLLFWAVALTALNDPLLAVGDEPVDPYLWLEDVAGAKASGLGQRTKRREHERADQVGAVPVAGAAAPRGPRLGSEDPGHPEAWPVLLQLLA